MEGKDENLQPLPLLGWNGKPQDDYTDGNYTISLMSPYGSADHHWQTMQRYVNNALNHLALAWAMANDHAVYWMSPNKLSNFRRRQLFDVSHLNPWTCWKKEEVYPRSTPNGDFDRGLTRPVFYWPHFGDYHPGLPPIKIGLPKALRDVALVSTGPSPYASGREWVDALMSARMTSPLILIDSYSELTNDPTFPFVPPVEDDGMLARFMQGWDEEFDVEGLYPRIWIKGDGLTSPYRRAMNMALQRIGFKRDITRVEVTYGQGLKKVNHQVAGSMRKKKRKYRLQLVRIEFKKKTTFKNCYPKHMGEVAAPDPTAHNEMVNLNVTFNFDGVVDKTMTYAFPRPREK